MQERFRSGLVWDRGTQSHGDGLHAIGDAESRHQLRSHPNAAILEMGRSVADLRGTYVAFLVLAFGASNLVWSAAVLLSHRDRQGLSVDPADPR